MNTDIIKPQNHGAIAYNLLYSSKKKNKNKKNQTKVQNAFLLFSLEQQWNVLHVN